MALIQYDKYIKDPSPTLEIVRSAKNFYTENIPLYGTVEPQLSEPLGTMGGP